MLTSVSCLKVHDFFFPFLLITYCYLTQRNSAVYLFVLLNFIHFFVSLIISKYIYSSVF